MVKEQISGQNRYRYRAKGLMESEKLQFLSSHWYSLGIGLTELHHRMSLTLNELLWLLLRHLVLTVLPLKLIFWLITIDVDQFSDHLKNFVIKNISSLTRRVGSRVGMR